MLYVARDQLDNNGEKIDDEDFQLRLLLDWPAVGDEKEEEDFRSSTASSSPFFFYYFAFVDVDFGRQRSAVGPESRLWLSKHGSDEQRSLWAYS